MARYSWPSLPGILLFDPRGHLLYSNHEGRHLYQSNSNGSTRPGRDLSFEIKRSCLRLKKLQSSCQANGEGAPDSVLESQSLDAGDIQYRLVASTVQVGSTVQSELLKEPCFLILLGVEEQRQSAQIDLTHYQVEYKLTHREIQILDLLSHGASYKEIGYTLMISTHTVRDHIKNIRFKLRADGKCGILARLIENAGASQKAALSLDPDTEQEAPLPLVSTQSPVSALETQCTVAGKTALPAVRHTSVASKRLDTVVVPNTHTPNPRIGRSAQSPTSGSLRLNGKREIQARGRSV